MFIVHDVPVLEASNVTCKTGTDVRRSDTGVPPGDDGTPFAPVHLIASARCTPGDPDAMVDV